MNEKEFMNLYNSDLRDYNKKLKEIYMEIEERGIVILSELRIELESEVLELGMSKGYMYSEVVRYVIGCIVEEKNWNEREE